MTKQEERREKIWKKFISEVDLFIKNQEPLPLFIDRMEKQGFCLEFVNPTGKEGLEDREFCYQIIDFMNKTCSTGFTKKYPSAITTLILARRKEGFTLEQMQAVITKKAKQWTGTAYANILTFEHLFDKSHFINYLGQIAVEPNTHATQKETVTDAVNQLKKPVPPGSKN